MKIVWGAYADDNEAVKQNIRPFEEDMTMTTNKMSAINLEQLDNVTGGTSPKFPWIIVCDKHNASASEKSVFPDIGRHGFETGNTKSEALLGIFENAKTEASILIMGAALI